MRRSFRKLRDKLRGVLPGSSIEKAEFANPEDAGSSSGGAAGNAAVASGSEATSESDAFQVAKPKQEEEKGRNEQYAAVLETKVQETLSKIQKKDCPKEDFKNFELVGQIGAGGDGMVFKVKYSKDQKFYAVKAVSKVELVQRKRLRYIAREKLYMSAIDFEFIVKLHFTCKDDKYIYFVMAYACYGSVASLLELEVTQFEVKFITAQIVLAIEFLHRCEIAHRDIKGENVFIFEDNYVKIGDFGAAKKFAEHTYTSLGTPAYMAPEVIEKKGYRREVDWWSMGILIYQLLFSEHPFEEPQRSIMDSIVDKELIIPSHPHAGSPVRGLLTGLLQKDPTKRLGSLGGGSSEIKNHEWFSDICFCDIVQKKTQVPPWKATIEPGPVDIIDVPDKDGLLEKLDDAKKKIFEDF